MSLAANPKAAVPVRWADDMLGAPFAPSALPGGHHVDPAAASPDGHLFLVEPDASTGGREEVIDTHGILIASLDPEPLYFWSTDSSALCVMHNSAGQVDDMRLGVLTLRDGRERDFYRFHPAAGVGLHGILSCSIATGRVVVEEIMANSPQRVGPPTVAALVAISMSGAELAHYDFVRGGHRSYVNVSDDGVLFAESPIDPSLSTVVREVVGGRVRASLQGHLVRGFDGSDQTMLVAPIPDTPGNVSSPVLLQLVAIDSERTLWSKTGYFRGTLSWPGHDGLLVGVGSQRITVQSGYEILALDRQGRPAVIADHAFFD